MIKCEFENGNKASLRHVVTDVILIKDGKIILERRGKSTKKRMIPEEGKWALIGGFVDRNESITKAAKREVLEETGWKIKSIKLFQIKGIPYRKGEDRQNIVFLFIAQALKKISDNDDEVSDVQLFDFKKLPPEKLFAFDHYDSVKLYKKYLKGKLELPLLNI